MNKSLPYVLILAIPIGITAQCRPKITKICHSAPIRIPVTTPPSTGIAKIAWKNAFSRLVRMPATGPVSYTHLDVYKRQL